MQQFGKSIVIIPQITHSYLSAWVSGGSVVKNLSAKTGDTGDVNLTAESGRSPGGENGNPLQYSCMDNLWGHKESAMTEQLNTHRYVIILT